MSAFKGTPGPWLRDGTLVYALHDRSLPSGKVVQVNRFDATVHVGVGVPPEEAEANATLIAAAPTTHEAGERLIDALNVAFHIAAEYDDNRIYDELPTSAVASAYFALRDSLRKATGEQA